MLDANVWMWLLTGAVTLISILGGTIFVMIREEAKMQAELIRQKADSDRLEAAETRWKDELNSVKDNNEKLIDKLQQRHDRELDALATRVVDMVRNTETNILSRLDLLMDMWRQDRNKHD